MEIIYYRKYLEALERVDYLQTIVFIILFILAFLVIRNWYNLSKKRSFRKKNKQLSEQLEAEQTTILKYDKQLENIKVLEKQLNKKNTEISRLEKIIEHNKNKFYSTLIDKEKEIAQQKKTIDYQKKAYEQYVNYKSVEANNTRLGAHFIKNVITQIYADLEDEKTSYKSFLGFQYKRGEPLKKTPSIKALKNIFKLLDYNVSALNKETITIEVELEHIYMFLALINYLKPNAKTKLNNLLNKEEINTIKIKPTLFFPFLENALKHGSLNDVNSFISIDLKQNEQKQLSYCLVNSAEQDLDTKLENNAHSKFGLHALKQLIDIYYPGSKIEHALLPNNQYKSELIITLK